MTRVKGATSSTVQALSISTVLCVDLPFHDVISADWLLQDSYPQLFDCSNPETWIPVTTNYHSYHEATNPSEPWYMPEFQGTSC